MEDAENIWDEICKNSLRFFRDTEIDIMVDYTLKARKQQLKNEERKYIEQMLRENPIIDEEPLGDDIQKQPQQLIELARQKRLQEKLKQAKMAYRLKFQKEQTVENEQVDKALKNISERIEARLLKNDSGKNAEYLQLMQLKMDHALNNGINKHIKLSQKED